MHILQPGEIVRLLITQGLTQIVFVRSLAELNKITLELKQKQHGLYPLTLELMHLFQLAIGSIPKTLKEFQQMLRQEQV